VEKEKVVTILEAMKLEIPVRVEDAMAGWVVEKVLVKPNDVVQAGNPLILLRKPK
jgi:urea carboxylase